MSLDALWWAGLQGFDDLAAATLSRLREHGTTGVVIGVIDSAGDAHFVSTDPDVSGEPLLALRAGLNGESAEPTRVIRAGPHRADWIVSTLFLGARQVGAVGVCAPGRLAESDAYEELRAQLAVAVDVVAARYGRRRLRRGLAALRRISSRFSGALTTFEIAQCATDEGIAALGASSCLVYRLEHDALEVLVVGDATPSDRPWARIAIAAPAPVSDAVRTEKPVTVTSRADMLARYPFMADHPSVTDQAWLALPLVVQKHATGALFFAFHRAHTFTPDELELAATIADQCAQALERTRLQGAVDELREHESEQRFRAALDSMTDLVTLETAIRGADGTIVDFRIDYMNRVEIDVAGRAAEDLTGRRLLDAYPAVRDSELFHGYVHVVETGESMAIDELPYTDTIDGVDVRGFYSVQIAKFGDGIIVSARDISEAREARLELEGAYEQLAAARRVARLGIWSIDLASGDVTFSEELYEMFGFDPALPVPSLDEAIPQFIDVKDIDLVQALVEMTPVTGQAFMVEIGGRHVDGSTRSLMVAGTVAFDEHGVATRLWGTAQDITEQRLAEQALRETSEQLERDHASLLLLQEVISPTLPDLEDVELHGVYVPAGEQTHVGGDWFDAVALDNGSLALVVGDVAGHGIAAAALMAQLRHALRAYLADGMTAQAALAALSHLAQLMGEEAYATCLVATYDPATRILAGASAGHLPYILARDDEAYYCDVNVGPPIGATTDTLYGSFELALEPSDTLILFTDGLIERRGEPIDHGFDRLLSAVAQANRSRPPLSDLCEQICAQLRPDGPTADDLCLLALRLPGAS